MKFNTPKYCLAIFTCSGPLYCSTYQVLFTGTVFIATVFLPVYNFGIFRRRWQIRDRDVNSLSVFRRLKPYRIINNTIAVQIIASRERKPVNEHVLKGDITISSYR